MKIFSPKLSIAFTAAILFFYPYILLAEDVCEAFAKYGIYDTRINTSDTDKASSFRSWFCQSKFESKQAADAVGLSLGYEDMELGFDSNSESWSEFSSNYCRDDTYNTKYRQSTLSFIKTINKNASNNMLACFMRGGLHVRVFPGNRNDTFLVQARLNSTSSRINEAEVHWFEVKGGACSGPITKDYKITSGGAEALCTRTGKEAVDISLTAAELPVWDSPQGLPKIEEDILPVPPVTTPSKQPVPLGSCVGYGGVGTVHFWGPVGQPCNGLPEWDKYLSDLKTPKRICSCKGYGSVETLRLWGPEGEKCGINNGDWGTYSEQCEPVENLEICACRSQAGFTKGQLLWGPKGKDCAGKPEWDKYAQYCVSPK